MTALDQRLKHFPSSYTEARERFLDSVRRFGWSCDEQPVDAQGPDGQTLSIDVACSSSKQSIPTLVLSGGLHGVEGFCGTAIQLQHLEHWAERGVPDGVRLLLMHALNPYGYAWLRRTDAENRDLNRSFLMPGDKPPESRAALVAKLNGFLNPKSPPSRWEPFLIRALLTVLRYGYGPIQNAIAGGQYTFPRGLFYGGDFSGDTRPSELEAILAERFPAWLAGSSRVVHVDVHTGLGKWADLMFIVDGQPTPRQLKELEAWYPSDLCRYPQQDQSIYQATGSFGRWCMANSSVANYLFGVAEFGTYHPLHVLRALRAENCEHHWANRDLVESSREDEEGQGGLPDSEPSSMQMSRAKLNFLEVFCPCSPKWRARVLAQGFDVIERTVRGLQADTNAI